VTTLLAAAVPLIVIAFVVLLVAALVQQRGQPVELSTSALFRAYLYLASLAGVVAFAIGLVALLNAGLASAGGGQLVYGGPPDESRPLAFASQLERRRGEDALRGLTFGTFGVLFWLVHWLARNRLSPGDQGALRRAYLFVGTAGFGVATLVFLPNGVYQALSNWLIVPASSFRQGLGDSLIPGIVALAIWLLFFRLAAGGARGNDRRRAFRGGPSGPPPEPNMVGASIGPGPSSRSAGAEAATGREEG